MKTSNTQAIAQGMAWVEKNLSEETGSLAACDQLGILKRKAARLERSIARRPTVAVFGASQSGKSYLVSSLAFVKGSAAMPMAVERQPPVDFLAEINPDGNQSESTALVTRFSPCQPRHARFPFRLRIFSQTDLACLLANSYVHDLRDPSSADLQAEQVHQILDGLDRQAGHACRDGMDEDDVWSIRDYLRERLPKHPAKDFLERVGFWPRAARVLPRVAAQQRWQGLQFLWQRLEPLNETFRRLTQALDAVEHGSEIHCPLEALVPKTVRAADGSDRVASIIDVNMSRQFLDEQAPELTVRTSAGKDVRLTKPVVALLGYEILMPLAESITADCPIYRQADVLDFPGYRSREQDPVSKLLSGQGGRDTLLNMLLRGKVAYLFEKYNTELDINALIYCVSPVQPNVVGLSETLHSWISETHGGSPEERQGKRVSLFVVQTMFDTLVNSKLPEGMTSAEQVDSFYRGLLNTRVNLNFVERYKMATTDPWTESWDARGKGFRNCYWVRKANFSMAFSASHGMDAAKFRVLHREHPLIQHHFAQPDRCFDGVMDASGGVNLLIENMLSVCNEQVKKEQLEQLDARISAQARALLERHHRGDDLAKELEQARETGREIARKILALQNESDNFGLVASYLTLDVDTAWQTYFDFRDLLRAGADEPDKPLATGRIGVDAEMYELLGIEPPAPKAGGRSGWEVGLGSKPLHYARVLFNAWQARAYEACKDGQFFQAKGLDPQTTRRVVDGIVDATERVGLLAHLAARLGPVIGQQVGTDGILQIATLASECFNDFVNTLGFGCLPAAERPAWPDGRPVFAFKEQTQVLPAFTALKIEAEDLRLLPGRPFLLDWLKCAQVLFECNVQHKYDAGSFDTEANQALGDILRGFAAAPQTQPA